MFFLIKVIGTERYLCTDNTHDPDYGQDTDFYFMRPEDFTDTTGVYDRIVISSSRAQASQLMQSSLVEGARTRLEPDWQLEIVELVSINKIIEDELLS